MGERYRAPAMVLAAAGHIEHEALRGLAERHFAGLPDTPASVPEAARYAGGKARENRDIEQTHLVLGFEGPSFREAGFYPAQVFSTLYGGGMSSRLFQEVREKRGLVYAIYSFASSAADTGLVGVYAGTAQESAEEVLAIVRSRTGGPGRQRAGRGRTRPCPRAASRQPADGAREHVLALRTARPAAPGPQPPDPAGGADRAGPRR